MTHHKHHDLIIAWAKGAKIQVFAHRFGGPVWEDSMSPSWSTTCDYRIKPEPKPDVVLQRYITKRHIVDIHQSTTGYPNVKYTFDGETGALKDVELIN